MTGNEFFKVNYGDFYKFTISSSVILLIFSIIACSFLINLPNRNTLSTIIFIFYFILSVICLFFIFWGVLRWKKKQSKLDEILDLDVLLKKLEILLKNDELMRKNKDYYPRFDKQIEEQRKEIESVSGAIILKAQNIMKEEFSVPSNSILKK